MNSSNIFQEMTSYDRAMKAAKAINNPALQKLVQKAEDTRIKLGAGVRAWTELGEKLMEVVENKSKENKDRNGYNWLSAPMLHPLNPEKQGAYAAETGVNYEMATIEKYEIADCEQMVKETLVRCSTPFKDILCFQINNNEDCFVFKIEDFNLIAKDAREKLPIKTCCYSSDFENFTFLGQPIYGILFCDPSVDKKGYTIHPPCLFNDALNTASNKGNLCALDTNTYWFWNKKAADAFGKAVMGIEYVVCPSCENFWPKKECSKLTSNEAHFMWNKKGDCINYFCGDCVLKGRNYMKAEIEMEKSRAENKARMYEPIRATAEAQLLEMLEDKEILEDKKNIVKTETTKERNKRLAAEAAKELKAEKKRKEEHLKACGLYKSPEQLKKEKEARFKAEIAQMSKRK
jgi:hypothetical protein